MKICLLAKWWKYVVGANIDSDPIFHIVLNDLIMSKCISFFYLFCIEMKQCFSSNKSPTVSVVRESKNPTDHYHFVWASTKITLIRLWLNWFNIHLLLCSLSVFCSANKFPLTTDILVKRIRTNKKMSEQNRKNSRISFVSLATKRISELLKTVSFLSA